MNRTVACPHAREPARSHHILALALAACSTLLGGCNGCRREPAQRTELRTLCEAYRTAPRTPRPAARLEYVIARLSAAGRAELGAALAGPTVRERAEALRRLARTHHLEAECFAMVDALDADENAPDAP